MYNYIYKYRWNDINITLQIIIFHIIINISNACSNDHFILFTTENLFTYSIKIRQLINLQESLTKKKKFEPVSIPFFSIWSTWVWVPILLQFRYSWTTTIVSWSDKIQNQHHKYTHVCNFHIMKVSKHTAFDSKEADKFYYVLKSKTIWQEI